MSDTSRYRNVLDKTTLVPLGAAVVVCAALFTLWSAIDTRLAAIELSQHDQGRDIQELRREVTTDQWTRTNHMLWVAEFRRLNPKLPVPTVEESR